MELSAKDLKDYFIALASTIEDHKEYLCELDRKLGDGDHGVTMSIGWQAVKEKIESDLIQEDDCSKISIMVGKTFLNAVGSSVGPLYATGFMRGAKEIKNKSSINDQDMIAYWVAFGKGIKERGQAEVGDKTMIDTIDPFVKALEQKFEVSHDFLSTFTYAVNEAKKGMESTKDMMSKRGRSSRLGNRSIGSQDPGATSAYLILNSFLEFLKGSSSKAS